MTLDPKTGVARSIMAGGFDFAPSDRFDKRAGDGFYHTGDIRFAVRVGGEWKWFSTAAKRVQGLRLPVVGNDIAVDEITATAGDGSPLRIVRRWTRDGDALVLRFELANFSGAPVELGGVGIPLSFNNILTDRSLSEAHEKCSFSDPYVGLDAGYVQVTRLKGSGPALVVVPDGKTPFGAWQTLPEPMRLAQTFEGTFEWLVHTKALAETSWKSATPWNEPTSETIAPNATRTFGLRFIAAPSIREIEKTLAAHRRPVAVGVPGYILPQGQDGSLFLKYGAKVSGLEVVPKGALDVVPVSSKSKEWTRLGVRSKGFGRARLTISYDDGTRQTIHYYATKPASETANNLGRFLFTKQWFEDPNDPFGRSPSVISYDREENAPVTQDNRAWIAGLGDEAGSGSWLAAAMKEEILPEPAEVAKLERFVDGVLWGGLQYKEGPDKYGVRKSMFYYAPDLLPDFAYRKDFNWTTWASWKKDHAMSVGRAYNYPHVVAAYLALYRLARNTKGLVRNHSWDWYLAQAAATTKFVFSRKADGTRRVDYAELGLMEGTVFTELLDELRRERWQSEGDEIEALLKERAEAWAKEEYPFGSEMAWDSTGQEEVYGLCRRFGREDKALVSLNSIVGYMPTVPHWGYNGNARRYWDFLYGGKLRRIERQLHHYGSGMNAIPVLSYYREHPDDFYLLRVGYGGAMGALSNIDADGFASAAFHSNPDTLKWDAYSGDYGPNFFGHTINAATYVVDHPDFGWLAFGGNLRETSRGIEVTPLDTVRRKLFIAPLGLWLTLDAGRFEKVVIARDGKSVRVLLSGSKFEPQGLMRIKTTVESKAEFALKGSYKTDGTDIPVPIGRTFVLSRL